MSDQISTRIEQLDIPTEPIDIVIPTLSERRSVRPIRAQGREAGLGLVPRVRPIGFGGVADMLALHRHNRRMRTRLQAA